MHGAVHYGARFFAIAMLASLAAACTTTTQTPTPPGLSEAPVTAPTISTRRFIPTSTVDPALAAPCITTAANKYFLPERVISAVNSRPGAGGGTDVDLQVDLRTAVCQVSANGSVRAVIDTTPKSADQVAAEAAAAKAEAEARTAPQKQSRRK
ncbi:hypothetical protein DKP76_07985 [Falsochrobactrum shanghaiense]|uniref:Uncharacterized protein n=1 Tax=Falsochrobactrum shanghaiense TaxID=2201899 RepID=A0A316JAL6_9HYPH|nr:hypothetical protein [Falsochrobactrum shanghaiense]PWL17705.1 hypothetical protein DKP76_07985 [Falsochrobactrum shanghaiense]